MRGLIVFTALLAVAYGIAPLQRAKETIKDKYLVMIDVSYHFLFLYSEFIRFFINDYFSSQI